MNLEVVVMQDWRWTWGYDRPGLEMHVGGSDGVILEEDFEVVNQEAIDGEGGVMGLEIMFIS